MGQEVVEINLYMLVAATPFKFTMVLRLALLQLKVLLESPGIAVAKPSTHGK